MALITGNGLAPLSERTREEMVTVFVPSSPTAFSGYVMVVPRSGVVELPMSVEEAMRLLISGGVLAPKATLPPPVQSATRPAAEQKVAALPPRAAIAGPPRGQAAPGRRA